MHKPELFIEDVDGVETVKLKIKIGRAMYTITDTDRFVDNGACVQMLGHSGPYIGWGQSALPSPSKALIKYLDRTIGRIRAYPVKDSYCKVVEFSYDITGELQNATD